MLYVMSDIHGCYSKYVEMLKKIKFSEKDTLYILGDAVDRGPNGLKVLLDIAQRKNVIFLRGNHEQYAALLLQNLYMLDEENCSAELVELFRVWLADGGRTTLEEFLKLSEKEMRIVLDVINQSFIEKTIEVDGEKYHLSHTVSGIDRICDFDKWTLEDFTMGEPDYNEIYFADEYLVTGHTPTGYIDKSCKGRIWIGNNHIALDCGAVFGNPLGCLCLDTFEEYYVD